MEVLVPLTYRDIFNASVFARDFMIPSLFGHMLYQYLGAPSSSSNTVVANLKEEAKEFYKNKDYQSAVNKYLTAIRFAPTDFQLYNNCAASYVAMAPPCMELALLHAHMATQLAECTRNPGGINLGGNPNPFAGGENTGNRNTGTADIKPLFRFVKIAMQIACQYGPNPQPVGNAMYHTEKKDCCGQLALMQHDNLKRMYTAACRSSSSSSSSSSGGMGGLGASDRSEIEKLISDVESYKKRKDDMLSQRRFLENNIGTNVCMCLYVCKLAPNTYVHIHIHRYI
jgi:hypothetical protein